jgi:hypothetical protein
MKTMMTVAALFLLCNCADTQTQTKTQTPTQPRETELRAIEVHTVPEGAAIAVGGWSMGYSPVTVELPVYKDNGNVVGTLFGFTGITAIPTAAGQYTQTTSVGMGYLPTPVTLYVYNTSKQ